MTDDIASLMKQVRTLLHSLKVKKLATLDAGDRLKLKRRLKDQIALLQYLYDLQESRCSIVLEALGINPPEVCDAG